MQQRADAMTTLNPHPGPLARKLQQLYLLYLGLLPTLATFAVLAVYGTRAPFLVFLGGAVAVGVYLASLYSYTRLPEKILPLMVLLLDGPLFALLALRNGLNPLSFAIASYLIDGTALWIAILILAVISPRPTPSQRAASIFFMLAALGATSALFWPYIYEHILGNGSRLAFLVVGCAEATLTAFALTRRDEVLRRGEKGTLFIALLILLWSFAMIAGNVMHEEGVRLWRF